MTAMGVQVIKTGPIFLPNASVHSAIRKGVGDILAEGETLVTKALHEEGPYDGNSLTPGGNKRQITGHYQRSINGKMLANLSGIVHDSNVVYGPWLEGISSRNKRTRFKGYGAFRRAKSQLAKKWEPIMRRRIADAVRQLGGGF